MDLWPALCMWPGSSFSSTVAPTQGGTDVLLMLVITFICPFACVCDYLALRQILSLTPD